MTGGLVTDCIFCRIVAGRAPADVVAQDDQFVAFRDARPMAPVHLLAVPRRHVASLDEIDQLDAAVAGRMLRFVAAVAGEAGMQQNGYRVISNIGRDAGQMVDHLHRHIVGGRRLGASDDGESVRHGKRGGTRDPRRRRRGGAHEGRYGRGAEGRRQA